ncbi:MAG: adenylate/guanylate cyclase domain-containing protein [Bacteroidota bacterium]
MKHQIVYSGINRKIEIEESRKSLLDISIDHKIPHQHECGGFGNCTTCRVRILKGIDNLGPKTAKEKSASQQRKWDPSIRLACQAVPTGDITLQRLIWSNGEVNQLQKELAEEGRAEERPIAILFCDLRNYTKLSSKNFNFDIAFMLNRFYTALGEPILMNNGIIYQYVGDEIIGVFGTAGGSPEKNCMDAIRAALGMQYALNLLNKTELKDIDIKLASGIGINFGKAYVGHLGHPTHRQFSVIGDPVNVASRIQSQTKHTATQILISESVLENVPKESLVIGESFNKLLAGKEESMNLFEVKEFQEMDMQLELQASLHVLLQDEDTFADTFYQHVFRIKPDLRELFKTNMIDQGRILTHMVGGIVYALSRPEYLVSGLKRLGRNHVNYGVKGKYYPIIREAMLKTIEETLGDNKTPSMMNAWEGALDFVTSTMQDID